MVPPVVCDTGCVLHPVSGTQQRHDDGARGDPLRKGGKFNAAAEEQTSHTKQPLHSTVPPHLLREFPNFTGTGILRKKGKTLLPVICLLNRWLIQKGVWVDKKDRVRSLSGSAAVCSAFPTFLELLGLRP